MKSFNSAAIVAIGVLSLLLATQESVQVAALPQLRLCWLNYAPCNLLKAALTGRYPYANLTIDCVASYPAWIQTIRDDITAPQAACDIHVSYEGLMAESAAAGALLDLTDLVNDRAFDKADFFEPQLEPQQYPPNSGSYFGVPFIGESTAIAYRKSVFTNFSRAVPTSYEEFLDTADFFNNQTQFQAGLSAFMCTQQPACVSFRFASVFAADHMFYYGGEIWDDQTYKVKGVVDSERNVEAMKSARRLYNTTTYKGGAASYASAAAFAPFAPFCLGRTPMFMAPTSALSTLFLTATCASIASDIALMDVPLVSAYNTNGLLSQGMGLRVAKRIPADRQQAALTFIRYILSRPVQRSLARNVLLPARKSVVNSPQTIVDNNGRIIPTNVIQLLSSTRLKSFWNLANGRDLLAIQDRYSSLMLTGALSAEEGLARMADEQQAAIDAAYPCGPKCNPEFVRNEGMLDALLALACIAIALNLAMAAAVLWFRGHPVMKASSPIFVQLTVLGAVILLVSFILQYPKEQNDSMCAAQHWLEFMGVAVMFSALAVKTYRIAAIFGQKKMKLVSLSNNKLGLYFCIIILCFAAYMVAWTAADRPEVVTNHIRAQSGQVSDFLTCKDSAFDSWGQIIQVILLLVLSALVYQVRGAPGAFHEAKHMGIAIYNFFLITGVVLLVERSSNDPDLLFLFSGIRAILVACGVSCLLLVPKFFAIKQGQTEEESGSGTDSPRSTIGTPEKDVKPLGIPSLTAAASSGRGSPRAAAQWTSKFGAGRVVTHSSLGSPRKETDSHSDGTVNGLRNFSSAEGPATVHGEVVMEIPEPAVATGVPRTVNEHQEATD